MMPCPIPDHPPVTRERATEVLVYAAMQVGQLKERRTALLAIAGVFAAMAVLFVIGGNMGATVAAVVGVAMAVVLRPRRYGHIDIEGFRAHYRRVTGDVEIAIERLRDE